MEDHVAELSSFLSRHTRLDVQSVALTSILGLTGTADGCKALMANDTILTRLLDLIVYSAELSRDALLVILNLSANEQAASQLNSDHLLVIPRFCEMLTNPKHSANMNQIVMVLSNLTRQEKGSQILTETINDANHSITLNKLIDLFDKTRSTSLEYLATVFSNLTQVSAARLLFLDKNQAHVSRLVPYTQHRESLIRRGGIIGCLRNLSFEVDYHEWLLSDDTYLLPALLLPLAGPEQFSDEENDQLPLDCQYLPDDKQREEDPQLRKMLLETIMKLCATKFGRIHMRQNGVYYILRELHKWEQDPDVKETCENVISILISDEPNPELENLHTIDIPPEVAKQLEKH